MKTLDKVFQGVFLIFDFFAMRYFLILASVLATQKPILNMGNIEYGKYKSPSKNDQRGPCPGLNTMANHGYLFYYI